MEAGREHSHKQNKRMMSEKPYYQYDQSFTLYRGGSLPKFRLAYETWGKLNAEGSNAMLIFTGLSPGAHAASNALDSDPGWWEPMIGPGKAIDTERFFVICANSLGSCKGSTGPASPEPGTGQAWRLRFPALSIEDIAASTKQLIDHLGIRQLDTLIGPSMGGMSSLAWVKQFPGTARRMINISSALASSPYAIAIRSLQREAICSDPNWHNGLYDEERWPESGMRFARKLGMISYRSAAEWQQRFGRERQSQYPRTIYGMEYSVESYLENHARRFIGQFDPASYIYLSRAMDWFDSSDQHGDAVSMLRVSGLERAMVIGVGTDALFPVWQQHEMAQAMKQAGIDTQYYALDSVEGHDAFLIDYDHFIPLLRGFLV